MARVTSGRGPRPITYSIDSNGCHNCTSHRARVNGYVAIVRDGRGTVLHRWLYIQKHGPISADTEIRHTCDNRICINMQHLIAGTHLDNMRDMRERGRAARGIRCSRTKLTDEQVAAIRNDPDLNHSAVARKYGVNPSTTRRIRNGERRNYK